jgi:hypothetical protein
MHPLRGNASQSITSVSDDLVSDKSENYFLFPTRGKTVFSFRQGRKQVKEVDPSETSHYRFR